MNPTPKWYLPVTIVALLWNLVGCAALFQDLMLTPEDIAKLPADAQALYAARPGWSVVATAVAVLGGALGCVGLIMRRRWATPLLIASLVGVVLQDISLFAMSGKAAVPSAAFVLQGLVLLIAIGLVLLARRAAARGWLA
jgi:hypothetical protein